MYSQFLPVLLLACKAYAEPKPGPLQVAPRSPNPRLGELFWDRAAGAVDISPDGSCGVGASGVYTCRQSAYGSCCGGNNAW